MIIPCFCSIVALLCKTVPHVFDGPEKKGLVGQLRAVHHFFFDGPALITFLETVGSPRISATTMCEVRWVSFADAAGDLRALRGMMGEYLAGYEDARREFEKMGIGFATSIAELQMARAIVNHCFVRGIDRLQETDDGQLCIICSILASIKKEGISGCSPRFPDAWDETMSKLSRLFVKHAKRIATSSPGVRRTYPWLAASDATPRADGP
jgi:hypothetical protein